jgi:hypothetical protein
LIEGAASPTCVPELELATSKIKHGKPAKSITSILNEIDSELAAMREVVDAASSLMQILPMDQLEYDELLDLYKMFVNGGQVVEGYNLELKRIATYNMTPNESRKFIKLTNLHKYLHLALPEAALAVLDAVMKLEPKELPKKTRSRNSKTKSTSSAKEKPRKTAEIKLLKTPQS